MPTKKTRNEIIVICVLSLAAFVFFVLAISYATDHSVYKSSDSLDTTTSRYFSNSSSPYVKDSDNNLTRLETVNVSSIPTEKITSELLEEGITTTELKNRLEEQIVTMANPKVVNPNREHESYRSEMPGLASESRKSTQSGNIPSTTSTISNETIEKKRTACAEQISNQHRVCIEKNYNACMTATGVQNMCLGHYYERCKVRINIKEECRKAHGEALYDSWLNNHKKKSPK
ncbi:hypothetical protein CDIK_1313 [Cucumispora dikerogammari]|nr:hypothetical protein CDIK_1313 [Cucumispora dikerogammari]